MGDSARKLDPSPEWRLVNTATGRAISLRHGFRIGRVEGDLLLADDTAVSSKHAAFKFNRDDTQVLIEDVGSRNGTFLNGKKIEPKKAVPLELNDKIEIGGSAFVLMGREEVKTVIDSAPDPEAAPLQLVSSSLDLNVVKPPEKPVWKKPDAVAKPALKLVSSQKATKTNTVTLAKVTPRPITSAPALAAESFSPLSCLAFIVLNVLAFVWAVSRGADPINPSSESLIAIGGTINGLTTGGQWWRLVTATFMHGGASHLASNMFVLYFMGMPVARAIGTLRFVSVYLCAGIIGTALGLYFNPANVVSVGASGSIFGVVGTMLVLQILHQIDAKTIGKAGILTTLNFIVRSIGVGVQGVDISAHIGGLLAGVALAYVMVANGGIKNEKRVIHATITALVIFLMLAGFAPHRGMPGTVASEFGKKFGKFDKTVTSIVASYQVEMNRLSAKQLDEKTFGKTIHDDYIPRLEAGIKEFEAVEPKNNLEKDLKEAELRAVKAYFEMLVVLVKLTETGDQAHLNRIHELDPIVKSSQAERDRALDALVKSTQP